MALESAHFCVFNVPIHFTYSHFWVHWLLLLAKTSSNLAQYWKFNSASCHRPAQCGLSGGWDLPGAVIWGPRFLTSMSSMESWVPASRWSRNIKHGDLPERGRLGGGTHPYMVFLTSACTLLARVELCGLVYPNRKSTDEGKEYDELSSVSTL